METIFYCNKIDIVIRPHSKDKMASGDYFEFIMVRDYIYSKVKDYLNELPIRASLSPQQIDINRIRCRVLNAIDKLTERSLNETMYILEDIKNEVNKNL